MTTFTSAVATGTWTPTILGGAGVNKGHTYNEQNGVYMRIGNVVFVHGQAWLSALGIIDGSVVVVGGLPFPVKTNSQYRPVATVRWTNVTFTGAPGGTGANGTSFISMVTFASGGGTTNMVDSALSATTALSVFLMYETS